jgi:PPM family protein phosphatase
MMEIDLHGMRFQVAGFSEQGPRAENQDAFTVEGFSEASLLALADGMGGEKSGRMAADTALQSLLRLAPINSLEDARRAVRAADRAVVEMSESNPDLYGGMGCALGVLALVDRGDGPGWISAHVGDVRILSRSPDGLLRLETRDHTPAFARWEAGEISLDEIPDSAGANRLQRAVGRGGEADVAWLPVRPGWSWLIVSDGIYKAMRLDEIGDAMAASTSSEVSEAIRRKVEERGADDNFTALFVRAVDGANGPAIAPPMSRSHAMRSSSMPEDSKRSAMAGIAAALGVLALVLSGIAIWTAREVSDAAADRVEMERLRGEVDSLRAIVDQIRYPLFQPSAPASTPGGANSQLPQGR